jgi:hypothetical protein
MSINAWQFTCTQSASFNKANSGYAATTAGPTTNAFSLGSSSGGAFLHQQVVASGQTYALDVCSGGNADLVGTTINLSTLYNAWVGAQSGAIQVETTQSGGIAVPELGLSGGGFLIKPGGIQSIGNSQSGNAIAITPANGNLVFRAVSGACLLSLGVYGLGVSGM